MLINRGLNIPSRRVGQVILNRIHTEFDSNWSHHNFVKTNFAKVSNVAKMNELQGKVWGKYIKKMMDRNDTNQKLWSASNVVSPNGGGYNWNYLTIDTYMSYGDDPFRNPLSGHDLPDRVRHGRGSQGDAR